MASIDLYTTCNLLRYISEWDPREPAHTKGGYMDGEIKVPSVNGKLRMEIQTYPAEDVDPLVANIHPCLLHVVRIGKGKRDQELEPVPTYYHWKQVFEIENGKVKILNRISDLDVEKDGVTRRPVPSIDEVTELHGNSIVLGRKRGQLNLILLQPKQQSRAKPNEASVTKVLADRLQTKDKNKIELYEQFFKKEHGTNLKRVRLRVDFFTEYNEPFGFSISPQTIIDTGNKQIGSMDFYDATPHKSCVNGGRKIIMVSEYNLAKDVSPVFQVYDGFDVHRPEFDNYLAQPPKNEFNLKNQTIVFITPPQTRLMEIKEHLRNYTIKLLAKRKGDGYTSNKTFNFRYIDHQPNQCPFCDYKVDSDELVQIEAGIERPKPRQKKRVMNMNPVSPNDKRQRVLSTDELSLGSPAMSSGSSASPSYSTVSSYEMPVNSPDSGIDTHGDNSDGGCSPLSELEYPQVGITLSENIKFQNQFIDDSTFVTEDEVKRILGMPDGNVQTLDFFDEDLAEKLPENYDVFMNEVLNENSVERCSPEIEEIMNVGSSFEFFAPQLSANNTMMSNINPTISHGSISSRLSVANAMMSNRDPMISHGSMSIVHNDGGMAIRKQGPVLLQQRRIMCDSTKASDMTKPTEEQKPGDEGREAMKDKCQKERTELQKSKTEHESCFVEDLPVFVMLFMTLLIIFKLITEYTVDVPHYAVTVCSMAASIFLIFFKKQMFK